MSWKRIFIRESLCTRNLTTYAFCVVHLQLLISQAFLFLALVFSLSVHTRLQLGHCLPLKSNRKWSSCQIYWSSTAAAANESYLHLIGRVIAHERFSSEHPQDGLCYRSAKTLGSIMHRLSPVLQQDFISEERERKMGWSTSLAA